MDGRHNRIAGWAAGLLLLVVWLAFAPVLFGQTDGANPFRDVPKDHWSVKAIEKLVQNGLIEGFPDGTFKGTKVITRYDLALHVARILAKLDDLEATGTGVSPDDAVTISRLTNEYKAELDLLGVKVDRLEKRLLDVEKKADELDRSLSNVRIEGFYRAEQVFVDEPFDFTHYPYSAYLGENPNTGFKKSGLYNLKQEAYLRFIGSPYIGGERKRNIETFVELKGVISGLNDDRLTYRFSDPPVAGDNLDDFATGINDERKVSVNKAHLKIKSKRMNIRAFANEAITDLTDPSVLLTGGAYGTWRASWTESFSFDQGVEIDGAYKKMTYFGSVLKDLSLSDSAGNNPTNLTESFSPVSESDKDVFAARVTYDVFKSDKDDSKNSLLLGASYVETIWDYDEPYQFNKVIGWDIQYEHESDRTFELTLNPLVSEGKGNIHDTAFKADASYRAGKLLATFKGYRYGRDFQSVPAVRSWVDTGINRNFRRFNAIGEEFTRTQLKFDLGESFISGVEDLTLTALYETKRFAGDPDNPKDSDDITGTRAYIQALADLSDKTYIEWKTEHQKDVLPDEKGCLTNDFKIDVKVWDETSMVGEFGFKDDYDRRDDDGRRYSLGKGKFSVNSQVNKWLFLNGYMEIIKNKQTSSTSYENGFDENSVGGEMTITYKDDLTLKGWVDRKEVESQLDPKDDGTFDTVVGEFGWNFSRALKFRWVHGFQDKDYINKETDFIINDYMELLYRPTEQTELKFTYGYDYENPRDGWDDGTLEFWRTEKIYRMTAQTDF